MNWWAVIMDPVTFQAHRDVVVKSTIQRLHRFILSSFLPFKSFWKITIMIQWWVYILEQKI
jgi:hypothetical protein